MNIYVQSILSIATPSKYTNWYVSLISKTYMADRYEKHHILPMFCKLGGDKDPNNLISLPLRVHYLCHWLLTKMFQDKSLKRSASAAFVRMANSNINGRNQHSKKYEIAKKIYAEQIQGDGNPNKDGSGSRKQWANASDARREKQRETMRRLNEKKWADPKNKENLIARNKLRGALITRCTPQNPV